MWIVSDTRTFWNYSSTINQIGHISIAYCMNHTVSNGVVWAFNLIWILNELNCDSESIQEVNVFVKMMCRQNEDLMNVFAFEPTFWFIDKNKLFSKGFGNWWLHKTIEKNLKCYIHFYTEKSPNFCSITPTNEVVRCDFASDETSSITKQKSETFLPPCKRTQLHPAVHDF